VRRLADMIGTFVCVPVEALIDPTGGLVTHFKNYWWVHVPGEGLVFYKRGRDIWPQANPNENITRRLLNRSDLPAGSEALLVEHVFVPTSYDGEFRLPVVAS
jgi:hypothetical protein